MTNTNKTQPVCPCGSGDVNFPVRDTAYCPWCDHDYGGWVNDGYFAVLHTPIDFTDESLREAYLGYEDAAMESGLFGGDC